MTERTASADAGASGVDAAGATPPRTRRSRRKRPTPFPVIAGSLLAFTGLFMYMANQLRAGHDPALGKPTAAAAPAATKRVVIKRIERRIIVTRLLPPRERQAAPAPLQRAAPVVVQRAAPVVVQRAAPVVVQRAAPVVRSAPAPTPPPAPVVTRSS